MFIVGITGGSGSGKSTFVRELIKYSEKNISVLELDNYYKSQSELKKCFGEKINYDHPDAFDFNRYISDINKLRNGKFIITNQYDYAKHCKGNVLQIEPCDILLLDGIMLFNSSEIRELCDIKIFIDTDNDIRLKRRIARDIISRGREEDDIILQYENFVKPMYEKYIEPCRKYSDIIINGNNIKCSVYEIFKHYFNSFGD